MKDLRERDKHLPGYLSQTKSKPLMSNTTSSTLVNEAKPAKVTEVLQLVGTGYRVSLGSTKEGGKKLVFQVGKSHTPEYTLAQGIEAIVDTAGTSITISGQDKEKVGQEAAQICKICPRNPYTGAGRHRERYKSVLPQLKPTKTGKATKK